MLTKVAVIAALAVPKSRVFLRIIWGHADGKALVRSVEGTKKDVLEALKKMPDDAQLGVAISKSGHVYVNGLSKAQSMEFGEEVAPAAAATA